MQVHENKSELERIPADWHNAKLESFLKIKMGQSPPSETYNDQRNGLPFFQGVTDFGNINPKSRIWCSEPRSTASSNQILFSVRAPVGEVNITNVECCIGRGIAALEPVNSDLIYCFYLLKFYKSKFLKTSQGTTFEAINRKDIANGTFPFTNNIHEQQKIASILSKVDELIQKTDQVIKQTQRLKKGLMQSLLTKGIGHTRFKTTSIGMIPESWVVTKLRQVVHSYKNGIYKSSHYHGHGTPNIRMFNINDGKVDTVGAPLLEVTKKEELDYNLHIGDILINRVNSADLVAKAGIVDHDLGSVVFDSMIIRLRTLNEKCNPYFLSYFLISKKYYDQIHPVVKHAIGQSSINQDDINNLEFALPPIREQQKIITIISNIDNCIQKRQSYKLLIDNLKIGIMQKLLTGKIRVKV